MTKNAYIHIPFCRSKCNYCSFVSFNKLELKNEYLDALELQIKSNYKGEALNTLYFGGGTPSTLSIEDFKRIIELFNLEKGAEITVEMNPEGITEKYLQGLKALGVNRISIGTQTFDDEILRIIGRRHSSKQVKEAVNMAKKAGFENISVDLIYGLPTQTIEGFEADLKRAIELNIQHVSLYGLKIDEGCAFYKNMPSQLPDNDEQADMYLLAVKMLKDNGFEHYEISNFALKGFESQHNLNYWKNNSYYGFGVAASGYEDKTRYTNEANLERYLKNPISRILEQTLSESEILEEEIFLGLRKTEGIDVEELNKNFNIDFENKYAAILKKYLATGHLNQTHKGYALSTEGILVSNEILSEFIE